jgi:lipopolysaccharide export LptBFGC system permease protein LptF
MKVCKYLTLVFFCIQFVLTSCNQNSNSLSKTIKTDTSNTSIAKRTSENTNSISAYFRDNEKENKIIDTIYELKEVKNWQKYLEKETKGKGHLQIWIADTPIVSRPSYLVQVGEDNGYSLVVHFNFIVYPDPIRIMYLNTINDDTLTLEQWRKTKVK